MELAIFILLVLAAVCFLVAVLLGQARPVDPPTWHRTHFVALGLLLWVITAIMQTWP